MFLLQLLLHRLTLIIPPLPPPQKKKLAKLPFCFIRNVREISAKPIAFKRNWLDNICKIDFFNNRFFGKICPEFFRQIPREIGRFFCEFISENPAKFGFFSTTYQRPCVMNGLHYKTSWSGGLFLPLLQLFSFMNLKIVQSWPIIVFKKSERLNYIRSVKEQTKCPAI